jgi:demethylmenaquinone methyltransferase/2-methoxy-6-polyprenyl-1,4-benzoquinol methylase
MRNALDKDKVREVYNRTASRYDLQHTTFTAWSDEKGRRLLVEKTVREGDKVLDAGAGTGCTALLAAKKVGPSGKVVLFDLSENMLTVARKKMESAGLQDRAEFKTGDILNLPFEDASFDVVLSTYSLCPVREPSKAALKLYRLVKLGGLLGIAHSTEPNSPLIRWLAEKIENVIWRFPLLSLGCRAISILPVLEKAGANIIFYQKIGVPLWPFLVFVVQKPK